MASGSFDVEPDLCVLAGAPERVAPLLSDSKTFAKQYEKVFGELRVAAIHLRHHPDALSRVSEESKQAIASFFLQIPQGFLSGRCDEAASIILGSTEWQQFKRWHGVPATRVSRFSLAASRASHASHASHASQSAMEERVSHQTNNTEKREEEIEMSAVGQQDTSSTITLVEDDGETENVNTFVADAEGPCHLPQSAHGTDVPQPETGGRCVDRCAQCSIA